LPFGISRKAIGKMGYTLWSFANGYDTSPVAKNDCEIPIKSIGNSLTAPRDLTNNEDVRILIYVLSESVEKGLEVTILKEGPSR